MTIAKQPLTENQINIILHEMAIHVLKDGDLWTKVGHELDLSDGDLSRVWDHAKAEVRNESKGVT